MIFKNLLRRKLRTILTALGVGIGVAAIVGLGALAEGMSAGYDSMISGTKADLVLSQPDSLDITYSTVDESAEAQLLAMPEVSEVSGMLQSFVRAENNPMFFIFGYPVDSFIMDRFQIIRGVGLSDHQAHQSHGTPIILGSAAAEALDKKVGETLRIQDRPYRIVGIFETGDAFEDGGAVMDLPAAQSLMGKTHKVSLYYIRLKDPSLRSRVEQRAARLWRNLSISGTKEFADKQMMGDMLQTYIWVIAALAILIGGVGMMNAQLTSVMERTREIGVLRSIGWPRGRILFMILGESVLVCILGGVLGSILGFVTLRIFSNALSSFGADRISGDVLVQAFITVLVLGLLGGLYPAWRASRLTPVEALRYEGSTGSNKVRRLPFGGLALQNLWQRTTRTALTLGVIGLTIGAIMAMEAVVRGMGQSMNQMSADSEIIMRQADIADTSLSALDARIGSKIAAMPEVASVSGVIFSAVTMPEQGGFFIIEGYSPAEYAIRRFNVVEGQPITADHQIMIGRKMADALHKRVGETLILSSTRYRITGIYESGIGWEELGGVMSLRDAQTLMGRPRKVSLFFIKVRDPKQAPAIVKRINAEFKDGAATLSGDFAAEMPDMKNTDGMMMGISLLALLVGGVGVLNTMLMSVLERTREIGVLRALGWRRRAILGLILRESLLLGLSGGGFGILLAFGLIGLFSLSPEIASYLEPIWDVDIFVRALSISIGLGVLGGLYPAWRATRLRPVEALRYE
jgi:ABC-type antimicrobial peptide transport system permease subunit